MLAIITKNLILLPDSALLAHQQQSAHLGPALCREAVRHWEPLAFPLRSQLKHASHC